VLVAAVYGVVSLVLVAAWFWLMFPVISPHMGLPGDAWWALLVGLPPTAGLVFTDRLIARHMHRPGIWTRDR
jgi:hypothetical protein